MLIKTMISQGFKLESLPFVRSEGVVIDFNCSQAFSFGGNMSKFKRNTPPLCACGCGEPVKWNKTYKRWNKYINGHHCKGRNNPSYGKKSPEQSRRMTENNPMHNPKCVAKMFGENNPSKKPEVAEKISRSLKALGENHPSKRIGHRKMAFKQMKENNPMHNPIIAKKVSKTKKGRPLPHMHNNNPMYNPIIAKRHSKRMIGNQYGRGYKFNKKDLIRRSGQNHWNWKGGISCEPYCDAWADQEYKETIRERDGHACQNPDCWGNHNPNYKLSVHHIDGNKKDCSPSNLITLCRGCNARAEGNKDVPREWWQDFYQEIMNRKYGYEYRGEGIKNENL